MLELADRLVRALDPDILVRARPGETRPLLVFELLNDLALEVHTNVDALAARRDQQKWHQ